MPVEDSHLEVQLLEEPFVLSSRVLFFQHLPYLLLGLLLFDGIASDFDRDALLKVNVKGVASWHDVVVVDELNEGLYAGTAGDFAGSHRLGDLERGTVDADDQGAAEALAGALVALVEMYIQKE